MTAEREPYCWICEDVANCELCRPDEPGQMGLFDANDDEDED